MKKFMACLLAIMLAFVPIGMSNFGAYGESYSDEEKITVEVMTPTSEPTATPEPTPTPIPRSISISCSLDEGPVYVGTEVTFTVHLHNFTGDEVYHVVWQQSFDDGNTWKEVATTSGLKYTFPIQEKDSGSWWRAVLFID